MPGSPTGRTSAVPSCSSRASPTRSRKIDLLRAAVPRLAHAELVTYPRLGHTLKPVLEDALDRAAAFLLGLPTA